MLKVFLVEDESIVREGLKNNIPWQEYGYQFMGEASDGEMALPMIRKIRPDVLITDIKMPFISGIELARQGKKYMELLEECAKIVEEFTSQTVGKIGLETG